jgi:tetratricopeptide (TPR) repeat protein
MTPGQRTILLIGLILALQALALAQTGTASPQSGAGTRRSFTLYGDLKVEDAKSDELATTLFDVILYTRVNEVFARQRVEDGGRYRFNNVVIGDYYLAVEVENVEVSRVPLSIVRDAADQIRQDLELSWKEMGRNGGSTAESYARSKQNAGLFERAMREIRKNELSKATATLRSLLEADPKDYPAWKELGAVYLTQKDFAAAANSYTKAVELKPDYVTALVSLGRVRLAQANTEAAIKVLETALKADPKAATANYYLGEVYLTLRKNSVAATYLNEALKLDPVGMATAHLRLAVLYHVAGRKDLAAIEFNEFLKKRPDYAEAQRLRDYIKANYSRKVRTAETDPNPGPNL